jgi:hypothetical protein
MVFGTPKCTHTRSKKCLVVAFAVMFFLQATRIVILEKQSTITKTQSFPLLVDGNPNMHSIEMDSYGLLGVGREVYRPCFFVVGLEIV